jgi:hypothetical protein
MYQKTQKLKNAYQKPILDIDRSFYSLPTSIQNKILSNTLNIFKLLKSLSQIVYSPNVQSPFLKEYNRTLFVPLRIKYNNVKVFAYKRGNYIHIRVKFTK